MNKLLSKRQLNVNENKVESIGVILNIEEFNDYESFRILAEDLQIHSNKLKVIAFSENLNQATSIWNDCFNVKDFGWNGIVKNPDLQLFLDTEFDVLINYYEKEILELKLITALSKAKFKIGILQTDERLNDLIVKIPLKEFNIFKSEMFKYLTILNKIK
nr:hypothetical protein [Flavivirga aquatica]